MSAPLTLALVLAVAIPLALWRAYRRDDALVERWAREQGVELTPESRPMVERYLRRARILRTWGGVAGAVLPSLVEFAWTGRVQVLGFGTDGDSAPLGFGTIFVGYLAGALCAELSAARPRPSGRRTARLVPRDLERYLPRSAVVAQRGLAAAGALGLLVVALLPYPDSFSMPGPAALALAAAAVLGFGAGLEAVERWLVRRPQPFTSPPLVAADDAVRGESIRAVAGAGLALLLLACGAVALALQASEVAALRTAMVVPAAACLILSVVVCQGVGAPSPRGGARAGAAGAASA